MRCSKKSRIRVRHRIARNLAYAVLYPYARWKYHVNIERFKDQKDRQYLILFNHQTPFDQFFIGMIFKGAVYHLATEDILSNGLSSRLISFFAAPIPIKKQTVDIGAIRACLRVAKEGGTVCVAPEGNRTYTGRTVYINPSIAGLCKMLGLPAALVRIEGGYGVAPRWSDNVRKGSMRAYVSEVIEPEDIERMSKEELYRRIRDGLNVDETANEEAFYHKKRAEYLERAVYICPCCKAFGTLKSSGSIIKCEACKAELEYTEHKRIEGRELSFNTAAGWIDWQNSIINGLNPEDYSNEPLFADSGVAIEEIADRKRIPVSSGVTLFLYGDKITAKDQNGGITQYRFSELSGATVVRKNKLMLYKGAKGLQFTGEKRFNALKYVNFYYRYTNALRGDGNGKILGH